MSNGAVRHGRVSRAHGVMAWASVHVRCPFRKIASRRSGRTATDVRPAGHSSGLQCKACSDSRFHGGLGERFNHDASLPRAGIRLMPSCHGTESGPKTVHRALFPSSRGGRLGVETIRLYQRGPCSTRRARRGIRRTAYDVRRLPSPPGQAAGLPSTRSPKIASIRPTTGPARELAAARGGPRYEDRRAPRARDALRLLSVNSLGRPRPCPILSSFDAKATT